MTSSAPTYFATEADFRRWLKVNHATAPELLVGFWKKGSGKPSIDWPQARDQALCFGWIDGIRKSLGDDAYTIRFTPRRKGSIWSKVNVARYDALTAAGQMTPAGEAAYERDSDVGDGHRAPECTQRRELMTIASVTTNETAKRNIAMAEA